MDEKDDEIAELNQELHGQGKKRKIKDGDNLEDLEREIEQLRENAESDQLLIAELRVQLSSSNAKVTTLTQEKNEIDQKLKAQSKRVDELEKELLSVNSKHRSAEQQSKEASKKNSNHLKEAERLFHENETLKAEVLSFLAAQYSYKCSILIRTQIWKHKFRNWKLKRMRWNKSLLSFMKLKKSLSIRQEIMILRKMSFKAVC